MLLLTQLFHDLIDCARVETSLNQSFMLDSLILIFLMPAIQVGRDVIVLSKVSVVVVELLTATEISLILL